MRAAFVVTIAVVFMMAAFYSDAGKVGGTHLACAQTSEGQHDHHTMAHGDMVVEPGAIDPYANRCCGDGCVLDLTVPSIVRPIADKLPHELSPWTGSNLADLIKPHGVRRPPRV